MTGPEHYEAAEHLADDTRQLLEQLAAGENDWEQLPVAIQSAAALAQAHATLALAAAAALCHPNWRGFIDQPEFDRWTLVAGTRE